MEWHQVDLNGGTVRLDPGTTKNREGRVFPLTDDLRRLSVERRQAADELKGTGQIVPWVFFRMVAKGRRGKKYPKPIDRVRQGVENGLPSGELSWPYSTRPPSDGGTQYGPRRGA
jgi:integrase